MTQTPPTGLHPPILHKEELNFNMSFREDRSYLNHSSKSLFSVCLLALELSAFLKQHKTITRNGAGECDVFLEGTGKRALTSIGVLCVEMIKCSDIA